MKQKLYLKRATNAVVLFVRVAVLFTILTTCILLPEGKTQGLIFKNSFLQTGISGQDDAVYRFPSVIANVDALVKINGRSSSLVKLESIDLTNTGFDKSFQPKVSYNNGTTPSGISEWWMEFTITFVNAVTSVPVTVNDFNVTALDIDGNAHKINEWVNIYNHTSYTLESSTDLQYSSVWEMINSVSSVVGTKFVGPVTNYVDIDTSATNVMATAIFQNINGIRIRTGGQSTGVSNASERMYSFWFKSFSYRAAVESRLPVTLKSFTAKLENKKPVINWISSQEENLSHFVLERSSDGSNFIEAALIFSNGNSSTDSKYSFADNAVTARTKGIVYYRLRMIDLDGKYKYSETRLVRMGDSGKSLSIQAYPNPAINELRITVPTGWQDKKIQYDIYTVNGQTVKKASRSNASQTEIMDISQLPPGSYIIRVTAGTESAIQQFVKSK